MSNCCALGPPLPQNNQLSDVVCTVANTAEVNLGDKLRINCFLSRQENRLNDLTYLVRDVLHLLYETVSVYIWLLCCF